MNFVGYKVYFDRLEQLYPELFPMNGSWETHDCWVPRWGEVILKSEVIKRYDFFLTSELHEHALYERKL